MKRQEIYADADAAPLRNGYDLTPPMVPTATGANPPMVGPYFSTITAKRMERTRPGYNNAGTNTALVDRNLRFTGARPGDQSWQTSAADAGIRSFTPADLLSRTGAFTVFRLSRIAPTVRSRLFSNYAGSVAEATTFITANPVSGTANNMTVGHSNTVYRGLDFFDPGRGNIQLYGFEYNRNTLPGSTRPGKLGALICPAGVSISAATEFDAYPGPDPATPDLPTGGVRSIMNGATWADPGFNPIGGEEMFAELIYDVGLLPFLNPHAPAGLALIQSYFRDIATRIGINW